MKKLFIALFAFTICFSAILGLSSCGKDVEFDVNFVVDGEIYATIGTRGEEVIKIPENPTKEGYTFDGWYWDKDSWQTPFTANSLLDAPLSSDMNVYAKWKEVNSGTGPVAEGADITSSLLNVSGETATLTVSNATETFSFLNDINVADGASYVLASDIGCQDTIASKTVALVEGDNTYYILVTNGSAQKLYTVTIRRRPMYTVRFNTNTNGESLIDSQRIEEGSLAKEPKIYRAGYTFISWNYDFKKPITESITISASWSANKNTPYRVEYYLQNIEDNNYPSTPELTLNLTGTTDTTATAEQKVFEHFTFNASKSTVRGNIDGYGSLVLKVYYTINSYSVTSNVNNTKGGSITAQNGTYRYGKELTFTASVKEGYSFLGWFEGETKVCATPVYTFKVNRSTTYTAKWEASKNTPYRVEYYLQNIDDNNYPSTPELTLNLTGTTDTTATAEQKVFEHFTFNASKSTVRGNIDGYGSLVLKVYYTINSYYVSANVNTTKGGSITAQSGNYRYGKELTFTASPYPGYDFVGWYSENNLLSSDLTYKFVCEKDVAVEARFETEITVFNFTSTDTTCTITGIKDKSITEIIIPNCVTSIGDSAFYDCDSLESVTIGNGVTSIGDSAFGWCTYLESVTIPNSVTSIGDSAFRSCYNLTSVTIPNSVTSIGDWAFDWCTSLESVTIGNGVTSIGDSAFCYCDSLENIKVSEENTAYMDIEGNLYTKDGKTLIQYAIGKTDKTFAIPDTVTTIGDGAFSSCDSLESVTIPNSVTSIGNGAFYDCNSLTSIKYRGTETQWNNDISKGTNWDYNTGNYSITYNYTGE